MKILMVCLGNICRSPLAEGIMRHLVEVNNLDWTIDSAGTSGWHQGEKPHKGSIAIATKYQLDISKQRSRQFVRADFRKFDLILAMDSDNYQNILKLSDSEAEADKVKLILNFTSPAMNKAVPDPYYTGDFEEVYQLVAQACSDVIQTFRIVY